MVCVQIGSVLFPPKVYDKRAADALLRSEGCIRYRRSAQHPVLLMRIRKMEGVPMNYALLQPPPRCR